MTTKAKSIKTEIQNTAENFFSSSGKIEHTEILQEIIENLKPVDFRKIAGLKEKDALTQKHLVVLTVRQVLEIAAKIKCGLCRNGDFFYTYNGEFWQKLDKDDFEPFLVKCAEKLGVDGISASYHKFSSELSKQFFATAHLPKPKRKSEKVLINLQNGTFEITENKVEKRDFDRADFLTYQLPFTYDKNATCPKWQNFLDEVLPEKIKKAGIIEIIDEGKTRQKVLAEYLGYVFARNLKLEKTLILFGHGANGKSVVFDVENALLGKENVTNYSLEALGEPYYRAMIGDALLNYASEISNRLQAEKFKQLTSGEPVEARLPYGQPMTLTNYARLAFNCNDLPRDVEHTEAFFRRFLIVSFDVTIPTEKRNPNLAKEIIETELSGVFNWVLEGLKRLLIQKNFTQSKAIQTALDNYRKESDSVAMFLDDENYEPNDEHILLKNLYPEYRNFCRDNGYIALGNNKFSKRLESNGIQVEKKNVGKVVYVVKRAG